MSHHYSGPDSGFPLGDDRRQHRSQQVRYRHFSELSVTRAPGK
jgi:hypothetical protein